MRTIVFIIVVLCFSFARAQNEPAIIDSLIKYHQLSKGFETQLKVEVDVPGIDMPAKEIYIKVEEGEKPKIKSKGLLIFPKKGIFGQFRKLLETSYQIIPLLSQADSVQIKLVSLEPESDWITADLIFTKSDLLIHQLILNTKENGQFIIDNFYHTSGKPDYTIVAFEILNKKLPLRFLGRQNIKPALSADETSKGKIKLTYIDFQLL